MFGKKDKLNRNNKEPTWNRLAKDGEDVRGLQITNSNEFSRNLSRS